MNFLETPTRRTVLFASLYFSEGAPIGFLWLALPTQLRAEDVPLTQITWLTAVLLLPWTLKFLWAPLVDWLRSPRFTLKQWILLAQSLMGLMLLPLLVMDVQSAFYWVALCLVVHAFAAATQDVAIDALCISVTDVHERGHLNGWMQAGMLLGRATMGGGALVLADHLGPQVVVGMLIACTTFSMLLVATLPTASLVHETRGPTRERARELLENLKQAACSRRTWAGLLFAVIGGAAFKSLEAVYGPYLIDRQFEEAEIGLATLRFLIGSQIAGALVGGHLASRFPRHLLVSAALVFIACCVTGLALLDGLSQGDAGRMLIVVLCITWFGIGWFTAASYALFMDLTTPAIAATQFSAFMGATNACESWSVYSIGKLIDAWGYPAGFLTMSMLSLLALPILFSLQVEESGPMQETAES